MTGYADQSWLKHFTEERRQHADRPPSILHAARTGRDRKKDMINASGFEVWPREVEDVLHTRPAVREAAVPDAYRGESVKAYARLRPGAGAHPAGPAAYCKERLAADKDPREAAVLGDLSRTATGKILRREPKSMAG